MSGETNEFPAREYFLAKLSQERKKVSDLGDKPFDAIEIATKVLRLCYPLRDIKAVHTYWNNAPREPFYRKQGEAPHYLEKRDTLTVDIFFLFNDVHGSDREEDAFVVEVTYPVDVERARWDIARVRWTDLAWNKQSQRIEDRPVPSLVGETIVNFWH